MGHWRGVIATVKAAACVGDATGRANWWDFHSQALKPKVPVEDTV
jgi:hypothetical protein